eukprot:TRINITY_DN27876_c0_g1_i1.p2 TRINITY_DN27876_c0_g1~~TRINITY_DN27876_c0_g1_i1.p2  ORF type:complete len:145 (-),score=14.28 TRINITY_DN27876_c0_g1_i1:9-443(-)
MANTTADALGVPRSRIQGGGPGKDTEFTGVSSRCSVLSSFLLVAVAFFAFAIHARARRLACCRARVAFFLCWFNLQILASDRLISFDFGAVLTYLRQCGTKKRSVEEGEEARFSKRSLAKRQGECPVLLIHLLVRLLLLSVLGT